MVPGSAEVTTARIRAIGTRRNDDVLVSRTQPTTNKNHRLELPTSERSLFLFRQFIHSFTVLPTFMIELMSFLWIEQGTCRCDRGVSAQKIHLFSRSCEKSLSAFSVLRKTVHQPSLTSSSSPTGINQQNVTQN